MMNDQTSHFERLGLPRRFAIDDALLEVHYLDRSRALHPDVHQMSSQANQLASLELSSALNAAYQVLKNPWRRGDYLLSLLGGPTANEVKDMPPAFLMEVLELREQIEALSPSASAEREQLATQLEKQRDQFLLEVAKTFAAHENSEMPATVKRQVRSQLNATKMINGLLADLFAE